MKRCKKCKYPLPKTGICPCRGENPNQVPLPTPEEIAERCAEIRAGWCEKRWAEASGRSAPWEVPRGPYTFHRRSQNNDS